jgi:hypothetical protein
MAVKGETMPNQLTLSVGTNTAVVPLNGTNAQINAVILRYAKGRQLPIDGLTAAQIGEVVLQSLVKYVRDVSMDVQRQELLIAQAAAMEGTLAIDNSL